MAGEKPRASALSFVRNGVTSSKHDRMMAAKKADTQKRRAADDERFAIARARPQEAKILQHTLGSSRTHASVVLGLRHPKDHEVMDWMICEITPQETADGKPDLMLVMCCPRCVFRYDRDPGESQMHIRQSNRMFYLDQRTESERKPNPILGVCAGSLWVNPKNSSEVITVAGMVTCNERVKCPVCSWTFTIDDSLVYTID